MFWQATTSNGATLSGTLSEENSALKIPTFQTRYRLTFAMKHLTDWLQWPCSIAKAERLEIGSGRLSGKTDSMLSLVRMETFQFQKTSNRNLILVSLLKKLKSSIWC